MNKYIKTVVLAIGFLLINSTGYSQPIKPNPVSYVIPTTPANWTQYYNSMAGDTLTPGPKLTQLPDGSLQELFPSRTDVKKPLPIRFNYLCHATPNLNITGNSKISATIGITSPANTSPTFEFVSPTNTCRSGCNPVSATLMIMGPVGGAMSTVNRWFAVKSSWPLALGKTTITADLNDPYQWVGVQSGPPLPGKGALLFAASKAKLVNACIVFGGGFYAGHGTNTLDSSALFDLYLFTIQ